MSNYRALGLGVLLCAVLGTQAFAADAAADNPTTAVDSSKTAAPVQQVVETVQIMGNRRLRQEDLMYYIKTRPGDVYDPAALQRDLKELLSLNFFDKTETSVSVEDGVRGGVNVIFKVKELPIIRDLEFKGAKALEESDILKEFREKRVGVSKESIYDPVKARNAARVLREMLASKGYPNAKVEVHEEEVSATSIAVTFNVDQGYRSRILQIDFTGNEHFKASELRNALVLVKQTGIVSRVKGMDILDLRKLDYDLQKNVRGYMLSKGYFQARIGEPEVVGLGLKKTGFPVVKELPIPLVSSTDDTLRIVVPVTEGKVYRVGDVKVEGNSIFSEQQILGYVGLRKGEIANGKRLQDALYEDLKKVYGSQGFVNYEAEPEPAIRDNPANPSEGIVDITIRIDEGKQFTLRRLEFTGNTFTRDKVMRREFLLNEGDIYNQQYVDISVARLNQTQYFDPIDKDQDIEMRTDEEKGDVDLIVKVKEKGRQQISFNGGVSGIGGTFLGLEYSTNNLAGRGDIMSLSVGAGNRQRNIQFSYQQPYFHDRPVSVGFSIFATKYQFFGEGTFLTQNQDLLNQLLFNPNATVTTDVSNLFTQTTYGASVFATAPLSEFFFKKRKFTQFSRLGLTYQLSATSIADPKVNQSADPAARIPVIYRQPNILTSRITGTFVYDTRQPAPNGIDTNNGKQLSISLGFAGLGGDVRTYSPSISYEQFIPIRNKRSKSPDVFAFRVLGATTGTWSVSDAVRNANSLAYIGGVPAYERFFLGSENDLRGYESRAIGPVAPFDTYITSRNVVLTTNSAGAHDTNTGLNARDTSELQSLGVLTGISGANPALFTKNFRFIGGDTELLGNFEYRRPIFGPLTVAAFVDVGSVFNLRTTGPQILNSEFLPDDTFLGAGRLTSLGLINQPNLESSFGSLLYYHGRVMTKTDYINEFCRGNRLGCPTSLSPQVQQFFLRGDVQQNSLLDVDNSKFGNIGDFKASLGLEFRMQVPIVNVPFRLIWYYNPNAKIGFTPELPGIYLPGKRSGFKFTVGRTF
ncbi:MAG: outer membrane protein assembly factor BamA [Pyrinomonadaceae bacterium]